MRTDRFKYHVIWIDDKCDELSSFITNAGVRGIGVKPFKYGRDGISEVRENPSIWDGIVLDVKCCYEEGELDTAKSYFRIKKELSDIKGSTELPIFVCTGQPDILHDEMFECSLNGETLYDKSTKTDVERLLEDIKSAAESRPLTKLRQKYLSGITFREIDGELIQMLGIMENDVRDGSFFNRARKILEWVMMFCNEVGILPVKFNGSNLSQCSRFLGKNEMQRYVPVFIQRSFHSAVDVSNNGSHRNEVSEAVGKGEAAFLIRSTMFELLNILEWCSRLPKDETGRASIRKYVACLAQDSSIEGSLEKDEYGNYHCGNCLVPYKAVNDNGLSERDIINIEETRPNTKQCEDKPYPLYAVKVRKV